MRSISSSLLLLFFSLFFIDVNAQTPQYSKSGGTDTCKFLFTGSGVKKMQFMYDKFDIGNVTTGTISRLYFRRASLAGSVTLSNLKIKMFASRIATPPRFNFNSLSLKMHFGQTGPNGTVLNTSSYTIAPASGSSEWFYIDLQTPFVYEANYHLYVTLEWDAVTAGGLGLLATQWPEASSDFYKTKMVVAPAATDSEGDADTLWPDMGVDVTIPTGPCPPPQNITATNITANSADMVWDPVPGATLYRYGYASPGWVYWNKTENYYSTNTASVNITNLPPGYLTGFQIHAVCGTDTSLWETEPVMTLPCDTPSGITATNVTYTGADLGWAAASGTAAYQYIITTSPGMPGGTPATTTNTSFTASGLNPGITYWLHLRRECSVGGFSRWGRKVFTTPACTAPTGLAAIGVTIDSAYLSWNTTTGIAGYEYAVTTSATPPTSGTATTNNYYESPGLLPGTTYYAHVRKECATGVFSAWSTTSFTTNTQSPGNLIASAVTYTGANLTWASVPGSVGYQYLVSTSATPPASGTATTATSYNATGLTPGTTYYLHVRTQHAGSTFSTWSTISFVTPSCAAVTGLAASGISYNSAMLNWNTVTGAVGYEWLVTTSATTPPVGTPTIAAAQPANGLNAGTTYYLHVRVQCATGIYSPWTTLSFSTIAAPVCQAPTAPAVTNLTDISADVNWGTVAASIGYEYAVNTNATPPVSGTPAVSTYHSITGLTASTTYYVHARAQCTGGLFSSWNTTSFTTMSVPCAAPAGLQVSNVGMTDADVQWGAVLHATGYEYAVSHQIQPPASGTGITTTSQNISGLTANSPYYVHVRASCGPGYFSPWSTTAFNTEDTCDAPVAIINTITDHTANVSWQMVTPGALYESATDQSATPPISGTISALTSYQAKQLLPNTTYYVHLRTICTKDTSNWATSIFVTTNVTSVQYLGREATLEIYPNPATDRIAVKLNGMHKIDAAITIRDIAGKVIETVTLSQAVTTIDMSEYAKGVYFLKYADAEHSSVTRIVKQ